MLSPKPSSILYLSSYPPRECGIATFTKDLTDAIGQKYNPTLKTRILALNNDITDLFAYDRNVVGQMYADNIEDYISYAQELNESPEVKLIHIQHEFGLFGGDWGEYLIPFLQTLQKPVVVTFHTVLPNPDRTLLRVVKLILDRAEAFIVMNEFSRQILIKKYGAHADRINVIPHGIPYVSSPNGKQKKKHLGLDNRFVLSTFGLLSPGKGIEYALRALPPVVKRHPNLLYLVIGATHPVVRKHDGESYRNSLEQEVQRLHLSQNVRFYNKYLTLEEIISFLRSTDIYLSPSLDRNQSSSGTLSYALGCGTPVVCTDSFYARSLVTEDTGALVKPKNPKAITKALLELSKDSEALQEMGKTAFAKTRHMTWPNVALGHFNLYQRLAKVTDEQKIPEFSLQHLRKLTDTFGVIQFAKHTEPDIRSGYSADDNARALIVTATSSVLSKSPESLELLKRYLAFLQLVQRPNGKFMNMASGKHKVLRQEFSEDTHGRAIWALGYLLSQKDIPEELQKKAERIFRKGIPPVRDFTSPRAIAFAILGLSLYILSKPAAPTARYRALIEKLADKQVRSFKETTAKNWFWFEEELTYSNSKLPESLFYAYLVTKKKPYLEIAKKSLNFLLGITFEKGYFSSIGQNGWYLHHGKRAYFDQQPEDASFMVQTLSVAWRATKKSRYRKLAFDTFQWFLGKNHLNQMVYDESTGGCYDGLGQFTLNLNQGAESTISYLLARLAVEEL